MSLAFKSVKAVFVCGFIFFWIQLCTQMYVQFSMYMESSRNQLLKAGLMENDVNLKGIENQIDQYRELHKNLSLKYGLLAPNDQEYILGVGGPLNKDSLSKRLIHPSVQQKVHFDQTLERISNKMEFNNNHLNNLQTHLEQKLNTWRNIPSIKPASGYYSSGFGYRTHPVTGVRHRLHAGLDIANTPWTPILSSADGVIQTVTRGPALGLYIKIDHGNGYTSVYGHLKKANVKPGQFVNRYDLIAYMGNSGRSTGTHLHYEIRQNGHHINPKDFILPEDHIVD